MARQFDDDAQRLEADTAGMWVFLMTEMMLFGALLIGYLIYRLGHGMAFTLASRGTDMTLGTVNTVVLLTSSLTMALAVAAARQVRSRMTTLLLALTAGLGAAFIGIKALEWSHEYREGLVPALHWMVTGALAPAMELFWVFYFILTGLHAVHLTIGVGWVSGLAIASRRTALRPILLVLAGLYWHFVDVVWVFLYPALYLPGRHP